MENKKAKFLEIKEIIKAKYEKEKSKSNLIAVFRGTIFLVMILFVVLFYLISFPIVLAIISLLIFIGLIIFHGIIDNKAQYYENYIKVIDNYLARIDGTYIGKPEASGLDFYNYKKNYLEDLDIIGKKSLYKFICIARTHIGRKQLYESLTNEYLNDEDFNNRQESIKELGEELEFALDFEAKSYKVPDNSFFPTITIKQMKKMKLFLVLGISIFAILVACFFLAGFEIISPFFLIIPVMAQIIIFYIFSGINKESLDYVKDINNTASSINDILKSFQKISFKAKLLKEKSQDIENGRIGVKKLSLISDFDTLRSDYFISTILNAFFPLSIFVIYRYTKIVMNYHENIDKGINAYQEFEALISLCVLKYTRDDVTMPKRIKEINLSFKDLKHPLLKNCVGNDFETKNGVNVITGSNMSGKTSFMRIIGINEVLMNAGTYVVAKEFVSPYLNIFTSMRISDDITSGISTFYAELLKIKLPIEFVETKMPMITLIDEVFSGTNSNDRITGAMCLLKKLNRKNSIVFITTHDFEICDLNIENLHNYYFSEHYDDNKILFDYKIKKGKCTTTNARYLMNLVGIKEI